jgi:crotonobetainyl-CoA:carnitine CoA-transferase CaiB-like acyl-CoA transferase
MTAPLEGLTVLEVANWVAAPSCTAVMADLGADVIKVEPPNGDAMRGKLRPAAVDGAPTTDHPFHLDNRGKRSLAVDLTDPRGAEVVRDLLDQADVLVTNLLPRRLERFGLGPAQLLERNPRLVVGLVTGFGTRGPEADRAGFDLTAFFGRAGIMSLVAEPGQAPPAFRPGQGDHATGLALLSAILAALLQRERTGEGQVVETSLLHVGAWTIGCDLSAVLVDGRQPTARAREEAFSPMNTRYRCGDGTWITLAAHDQRAWPRFCRELGLLSLADDERFDTPRKRYQHGPELVALLDEQFATAPAEVWGPRLDAAGVVWEPVATLPDLLADPQARAAGLFAEVDHPEAGAFETLAAPLTMHGGEAGVRGPAPEVGAHTREVLRDAGLDASHVEALHDAGVVGPRFARANDR